MPGAGRNCESPHPDGAVGACLAVATGRTPAGPPHRVPAQAGTVRAVVDRHDDTDPLAARAADTGDRRPDRSRSRTDVVALWRHESAQAAARFLQHLRDDLVCGVIIHESPLPSVDIPDGRQSTAYVLRRADRDPGPHGIDGRADRSVVHLCATQGADPPVRRRSASARLRPGRGSACSPRTCPSTPSSSTACPCPATVTTSTRLHLRRAAPPAPRRRGQDAGHGAAVPRNAAAAAEGTDVGEMLSSAAIGSHGAPASPSGSATPRRRGRSRLPTSSCCPTRAAPPACPRA